MKTKLLLTTLLVLCSCKASDLSQTSKLQPEPSPVADEIVEAVEQSKTQLCLGRDYRCNGRIWDAAGRTMIYCQDNPLRSLGEYSLTEELTLSAEDVDAGHGDNVSKPYTTELLLAYDSVVGESLGGVDAVGEVMAPAAGVAHIGTGYYVVTPDFDTAVELIGNNEESCLE